MATHCPRVITSRLAVTLSATRTRLTGPGREVFELHQHVRGTSAEPPQTTLHVNLSQQEVIMQRLREVAEAAKGSPESKMAPHQLSEIAAHLSSWQVKLTTSEEELLNVYRGWVLTADY